MSGGRIDLTQLMRNDTPFNALSTLCTILSVAPGNIPSVGGVLKLIATVASSTPQDGDVLVLAIRALNILAGNQAIREMGTEETQFILRALFLALPRLQVSSSSQPISSSFEVRFSILTRDELVEDVIQSVRELVRQGIPFSHFGTSFGAVFTSTVALLEFASAAPQLATRSLRLLALLLLNEPEVPDETAAEALAVSEPLLASLSSGILGEELLCSLSDFLLCFLRRRRRAALRQGSQFWQRIAAQFLAPLVSVTMLPIASDRLACLGVASIIVETIPLDGPEFTESALIALTPMWRVLLQEAIGGVEMGLSDPFGATPALNTSIERQRAQRMSANRPAEGKWIHPPLLNLLLHFSSVLLFRSSPFMEDYSWLWGGDETESGFLYGPEMSAALTRTFQQPDAHQCVLNSTHTVDLRRMVQINVATGRERRVTFQPVPSELTLPAHGILSWPGVALPQATTPPAPPAWKPLLPLLEAYVRAQALPSEIENVILAIEMRVALTAFDPVEAPAVAALIGTLSCSNKKAAQELCNSLIAQDTLWAPALRDCSVDPSLLYHCHLPVSPSGKRMRDLEKQPTPGKSVALKELTVPQVLQRLCRARNPAALLLPLLQNADPVASRKAALDLVNRATKAQAKTILRCSLESEDLMRPLAAASLSSLEELVASFSLAGHSIKVFDFSNPEALQFWVEQLEDQVFAISFCQSTEVPKKCECGAALVWHQSVRWRCNICGDRDDRGSMACRKCDVDLCQQCASAPRVYFVDALTSVGHLQEIVAEDFHSEEHLSSHARGGGSGRRVKRRRSSDVTAEILDHSSHPLPASVPLGCALLRHDPNNAELRASVHSLGSPPFRTYTKTITFHVALASDGQAPSRCQCGGREVAGGTDEHDGGGPAPQVHWFCKHRPAAAAIIDELRAHPSSPAILDHSISVPKELFTVLRASAPAIALLQADGLPSWIRDLLFAYSHVLPFEARRSICRYVASECWHSLWAAIRRRESGGGFAGFVPQPKHSVERGASVLAGFDALTRVSVPNGHRLDISFSGEEGTGEGPTQECYDELSRFAVSRSSGMCRGDSALMGGIFPAAEANPKHWRTIGFCYGRSLVDGYQMSAPLHEAAWRLALRLQSNVAPSSSVPQSEDLQVLQLIEPEVARHVISLSSMDLAQFHEFLASDGVPLDQALTPALYIARTTANLLGNARSCIAAFMNGVSLSLPISLLSLFTTASELNKLFCGMAVRDNEPLFDEVSLRRVIVGAHGYSTSSQQVQDLIAVLAHFTPLEQRYFIEFLTGTPRLPSDGLAGLGKPITVVRKDLEHGVNNAVLPSCNTCFLYLKLPPYSSAEILEDRLRIAITEGRRNFSLS